MKTTGKTGRYSLFLGLLLVFCLLAVSCNFSLNLNSTGAIKAGSWNGNTFTNSWSDLKFTLPDGARALTQGEITSVTGAGSDVLMNDLSQTSAVIDAAKAKSLYDAYVVLSDDASNVILTYENLGLTGILNGKDLTADAYSDVLKETLTNLTTIEYTFIGKKTATVAGHEYVVSSYSINDLLYQDYYVRLQNNAAISLIVSYTEDSSAAMQKFLDSFQSAA